MTTSDIAKIVYESQRAYNQQVFGDFSQKPFDQLVESSKGEVEARVLFCVENRNAPASSLHDRWLSGLLCDGWRKGDYTDVKNKIHKRLIPWSLLPNEEQVRDVMFMRIVGALIDSL